MVWAVHSICKGVKSKHNESINSINNAIFCVAGIENICEGRSISTRLLVWISKGCGTHVVLYCMNPGQSMISKRIHEEGRYQVMQAGELHAILLYP